jgi:signal transduction histidine kinase
VLGSLRGRLIASYAFVVFISLFLAGSGFLWLGQQYQMQREMQRLADIVLPLSAHVRYLELMGTPTADIAAFLDDQAQHLNVRLLLVRTGDRVVAADTSDELQGYILPPDEDTPSEQSGRLQVGRYQAAGGQVVTISVAGALQVGRLSDRLPPRFAPRLAVMVAVPQASLAAAWLALAPRLRGHYEQTIPVEGQDEISRLASAFNLMAKQVSLSHSTLREFLADVSHELRTPLTSIRGFSQAMTDGALRTPAEYAEAGQVIHEEAERMSRLVESLLHLSRVESGQFAGEHHPLDLAALVGACVSRAERRASATDVALAVEAQPTPPVLGETHRLEEVVDNLLDNAIKHTPPGGRITVRLAPDPPQPAAKGTSDLGHPPGVRLAVHNTGSLIPVEAQPRVFDRFYRGTAAHGEGHGLGLAIARQIVEAYHGRIGVTSTPEDGTEFTVWLPAAPAPAAANSHTKRSRDAADSGASVGSLA